MKTATILAFLLVTGIFSQNISAQNARQYYKTGLTFVEAKNHRDAIAQFTKAIEIDPEYAQAYVERSRSYEAINDLQNAADDLKRALTFEQKEPEIYYDAARLNYQLGNHQAALELINKCLSMEKKSEVAHRLLARIQMALEDYSNSLVTINKAIELKDNAENNFYRGVLSEKMKNYNQAEIDYKSAISKKPDYTEALLSLASLKLMLNKPQEALEYCNTVIAKDPNHKEALLIRSRIHAKLTEYPAAIDDLSKILYNNPDDKQMYVVRGNYYQEFTQHQQAINDFSKALLLDPKYSEAIYKRAYSYEQVGDFKSAIKDYESLTTLSSEDLVAQQHLNNARKRLFELNRESVAPKVSLIEPQVFNDSTLKIARNKISVSLRGRISDQSEISKVTVNKRPVNIFKSGENYEFTADIEINLSDVIIIQAIDVYDNIRTVNYSITRTEIDPPVISILAPYASDNGEIYLDTDNSNLYVEGTISDESTIKSILIDGVAASFTLDDLNPRFTATINIANKNKFNVTATDIYGNDTIETFTLNREGVSLLEANPMGRTWVVFIENSNYETFPSLDGPSKDVTLMRSALARYDIQKIIHKQDMTKKEMERFFSIELRDLLRSNKVNALLVWYAGHGKFYNETGYWIPIDAKRDDEFTYYNLNALRASLQSYTSYITHDLVVTDACESGPTFYQAMRETPKERNCNDWEAVKFKSSQVFSSAGYELAVDNSQFTKTFANTLANNPNACLPIESIVNKVTMAVTQSNQQKPKFGKITGLEDEDGTFFFMSKNK
ncbi:MAG TPA: tetratricopeptide repeat protein [Bacteroidales bacterium]|nr:tetratricopeptide repeat protein [Bacteroidales bacterium]